MESYAVLTNGPWYSFFYIISFWATLVILLIEGIKRKIPLLKWVIFLVFIRILFIAGSKIIYFENADWINLLIGQHLTDIHQQSFISALLFGVIGLIIGKYFFKFKQNIIDSFAFVLPVALAIIRIGCFGVGCCYGKVSNVPWAVKYPVNTLPHYHHFDEKLISLNETASLPVHPVQLYEFAGLIFVVFMILKFRKLLKQPGSLTMLSIAMILIVRFFAEFFRDINAHTLGAETIWIFNMTQIIVLPVAVFLIIQIRRRETAPVILSQNSEEECSLNRLFFINVLLILAFIRFESWFVKSEIIVISTALTVSAMILLISWIRQLFFPSYRWEYLLVLVLPFMIMSQTIPEHESDSTLTKKFKTIRIGFASGNFDNSYDIGQGEGCDRVSNTQYFNQKYYVVGAGLEFAAEQYKFRYYYGTNAIFGNHQETRISDNYQTENAIFDINPYGTLETNWVGFGVGFHAGNLAIIYENTQKDGYGFPSSGTNRLNFYPQAYFRFGPQRWFFVDYHLADNFPSALPGFRHLFGIGSGLGFSNGTNIRLGTNLSNFAYVSTYFPIRNKFVVQPMLLWGKSVGPDSPSNTQYQFSLGIGYRFGLKEEYKKKIMP